MFEKQRQALQTNANVRKAKLHVQIHKTEYAFGAGIFIGAGAVLVLKSRPVNVTNVIQVQPTGLPFNYPMTGMKFS